ncbi:hypothetical protein BH09DEP1_BH09DEP1_2890 [soil metagenome]
MKKIIFVLVCLISQFLSSYPSKIIFADGKEVEVPDKIEIFNDTNEKVRVVTKVHEITPSPRTSGNVCIL